MSVLDSPLANLRIIESSLLGGAALTTSFADLGAEVIKVESPSGDYIRKVTWPIIEGTSLMHYHLNRGKKSIVIDLKTDSGKQVYKDLVKDADVVVETMRPGTLANLRLGYDELKQINPRIVFINVSGYGATGPYQTMPSHGIAYDTWSGVVKPAYDEEGLCYIPEHISIGLNAAPLLGGMAILAGVLQARETGKGSEMEMGQSDAAAFFNWYSIESHMAYRRSEDVVTGNVADNYKRRPVGTAGMKDGVRYQIYEANDGYILFMASEQLFWKNFCEGVGRTDLFEKWPGSHHSDHARGNRELQRILSGIFKGGSTEEWMRFGAEKNTPIAPVNTPETIVNDPQFRDRFRVLRHEQYGADMLAFPVNFYGEKLPEPARAPTVGQHMAEILREVLGYTDNTIEILRESGAFGCSTT